MPELTAQQIKHVSPVALRLKADQLRAEFSILAEQWRRDTVHFSRTSQKIAHLAYQEIIGMGESAVPLLLEELRDRPSHWFVALKITTGINPVPAGANPVLAREAWLEWGRREGLVD